MSTKAYYHPRRMEVDLANLPTWLYLEIASLHGKVKPPPAPPVLTCSGNGAPMYVWRLRGRYFARHYPGDNPAQHSHHIATRMSDEHRRICEYGQRAAERSGLATRLELPTGAGTRLDLAVYGKCNTGFEVQRSSLSSAAAKARAAKSFRAGWPTAWVSDQERKPSWADLVPTARLETRTGWDYEVPPRNTARVIISEFDRERDRAAATGWKYRRRPYTVLLDDLAHLMPEGAIVPVKVGKKGYVVLASASAREVIDSCTFPGASLWTPHVSVEARETAQHKSALCHHASSDDCAAPVPTGMLNCHICGHPLWAPISVRRGFCEGCKSKVMQ